MDIDVDRYLGAMTRMVESLEHEGKPARKVILKRTYPTTAPDLWDAVTNPERLPRWFLPVEGDLRLGGHYQTKGNAGGKILVCDAPEHLGLTWEFGGGVSWVDVYIKAAGDDEATLTLEHLAHVNDHWKQYGPGAVGVGWDLALIGMNLHLSSGGAAVDPSNFESRSTSEDGKRFIRGASKDWGEAAIAAGEDETAARASAQRTTSAYTSEQPSES